MVIKTSLKIKVRGEILNFVKFNRQDPTKFWFNENKRGFKAPREIESPGMNQYVQV